jgi:hypothetical protein
MDVLQARVGFQGLTIWTQQFGALRAWGPEIGSLNDADADGYVRQSMAAGFSAVEFAVSWNYQEASFSYPVPGSDLSQNLPELRRRVRRAIQVGAPLGLKAVFLFCAGDGESNPNGGYNDPQGWTYGRSWLMHNFARIYEAFGPTPEDPNDLRSWMVFLPGYDGCDAYGWVSGENVASWWKLQNSLIKIGYKGFEWPTGQIQLGDGFPTYSPENGGSLDLWLLEEPTGPYPPSDTHSIQQLTQQIGRAVRPYNRPSWAVDDPHPPLLIPEINAGGLPAVVQIYEFYT